MLEERIMKSNESELVRILNSELVRMSQNYILSYARKYIEYKLSVCFGRCWNNLYTLIVTFFLYNLLENIQQNLFARKTLKAQWTPSSRENYSDYMQKYRPLKWNVIRSGTVVSQSSRHLSETTCTLKSKVLNQYFKEFGEWQLFIKVN